MVDTPLRSVFLFRELIVHKPVKKQPGFIESKILLFESMLFYVFDVDVKSKIMSNSYVRNYIFQQAQKKVMSQTQGLYPAPLKILDVCLSFISESNKNNLFIH